MMLCRLLEDLDCTLVQGRSDIEVNAICCDSRSVTPGCVFVCLPGQHTDGRRFAHAAAAAGAAVLVFEGTLPNFEFSRSCSPALVQAEPGKARRVLALMASRLYGYPARRMTMIGITGTKGKSTTAYYVRSILNDWLTSEGKPPCAILSSIDNYDGDITDRVVRSEEYGKIIYAVTDSSGNPGYAEREVPYYDPIPPEIMLEGDADMAITTGTFYQEPGYTAADNVDGDLTQQVQVDGEVDWLTPGTYSVTYTVTDGYKNTTTVTRTVEVQAVPRPEVVWPEGKVIYLTFDDGPGPYTEQLLDVLDSYGVKATFFVTNRGYGEMMKEIVDRGHSIGIHTMSHVYERIYASPEAYFSDLLGMQDVIYQNTGVKTTLMRFPGGSSNTVSAHSYVGLMSLLTRAVQDAGFQYFDWNVDSNDAGGAKKAQTVFNNVTAGVSQNRVSVVLQHDIHDFSVDAVEDIIVWGLNNGYSFERLTENSPGVHHGVQN